MRSSCSATSSQVLSAKAQVAVFVAYMSMLMLRLLSSCARSVSSGFFLPKYPPQILSSEVVYLSSRCASRTSPMCPIRIWSGKVCDQAYGTHSHLATVRWLEEPKSCTLCLAPSWIARSLTCPRLCRRGLDRCPEGGFPSALVARASHSSWVSRSSDSE